MEQPSRNKSFEENATLCLILIAFGYFILRLLYFATHISHYVPPDEITHFGISQIFSQAFLLPENSEQSYSFGLVTHVPHLYYFVMGKCLKLNFFPVSNLVFLRFLNCMLSFTTVVYGYKWMRLITDNRLSQLLFVILITNTPMFSFLGATVSYDNLTNFFAVTALYYLHLFFQNRSPSHFLLFAISLCGGALTKITFLPLILAYLAILVFHERKRLKSVFSLLKILSSLQIGQKVLMGIVVLLLILNMTLYLGNLIRFRKIVPSPGQVLTDEQSMKFRNYARYKILSLYQSGRLTFDEAIEKANTIEHPGDRAFVVGLLKTVRDNMQKQTTPMTRIQYAWVWILFMFDRSVGIIGHIVMRKDLHSLAVYQFLFLSFLVLFIRYWRPTHADGRLTDALLLCLSYAFIIFEFRHYRQYTQTLAVGVEVQGRYFFPVLVPFFGIISYYLITPLRRPFRILILVLVSAFFVWGDFPYFLQNATPQWFLPNGG